MNATDTFERGELPACERLRHWGPDFLGASELAKLISDDVSPEWLLSASFHELRLRLGPERGEAVGASLELGRRAQSVLLPRERLEGPEAVARWASTRLTHVRHEELWLLSTDARGGLLSARRIAHGSAHGLSVRVSDILHHAVREGAVGFLLVHNHPSGDPTPSAEDVELTTKVAAAAEVIGLALLDHVVVAKTSFASILTRLRRDIGERTHSEANDISKAPLEGTSPASARSSASKQRRATRRR